MNERAQAIETLKKARDLLAEQLTERIVEAREEILDDATGESFLGEIEQLYEKFGSRLGHLSTMLSSLPPLVPGLPPQKPPDAAPAALPAPESEPAVSEEISRHDMANEAVVDGAAMVEPASIGPVVPEAGGEEQRVTFETFVERLRASDMQGAGEVLGVLFGVDVDRGVRCAVVFAEKFVADQTVMLKAMNLRTQLQVGNINASLMLLSECFGLQGMESIGAMQMLKASLSGAS